MLALEEISPMWTAGIIGLLLGIALGSIAAWLIISRNGKTRQLQAELNELREHFNDYRDQVTQHFMQTSSLVQAMTESYRSVYEHLASGAQRLCNINTGANQLHQSESEKIDALHAAGTIATEADFDYDELAEITSIRNDIDRLMGESQPVSDHDTRTETEDKTPLQH